MSSHLRDAELKAKFRPAFNVMTEVAEELRTDERKPIHMIGLAIQGMLNVVWQLMQEHRELTR